MPCWPNRRHLPKLIQFMRFGAFGHSPVKGLAVKQIVLLLLWLPSCVVMTRRLPTR
jgi:hypothetical protein